METIYNLIFLSFLYYYIKNKWILDFQCVLMVCIVCYSESMLLRSFHSLPASLWIPLSVFFHSRSFSFFHTQHCLIFLFYSYGWRLHTEYVILYLSTYSMRWGVVWWIGLCLLYFFAPPLLVISTFDFGKWLCL